MAESPLFNDSIKCDWDFLDPVASQEPNTPIRAHQDQRQDELFPTTLISKLNEAVSEQQFLRDKFGDDTEVWSLKCILHELPELREELREKKAAEIEEAYELMGASPPESDCSDIDNPAQKVAPEKRKRLKQMANCFSPPSSNHETASPQSGSVSAPFDHQTPLSPPDTIIPETKVAKGKKRRRSDSMDEKTETDWFRQKRVARSLQRRSVSPRRSASVL